MSRIPPASTRLSSGTLNYVFIGTSNYFFVNQLKQNLALQHTFRCGQHLLYNYARITKRKRKPIVHPCVLPIYTQLRAKNFFNLQFNQSQSWFLEKAQSGAVGLVLSRCLVALSHFVACPTSGQRLKPKPTSGLGRFKLNAFDGIKSLSFAPETRFSKTNFRTRGYQTYAGLSSLFGCLKKTEALPWTSAYASNISLMMFKFSKKPNANRLQNQASLNSIACINNQRQAYGGMADWGKNHEFVRLLQQQLQTRFKSGNSGLTPHAYEIVNPGYKSRAVDFMLFCIVELIGAKPRLFSEQSALSKLNPNGLTNHNAVKKPTRYDYFSLKELSQTQSARLTYPPLEKPKQPARLDGLKLAHYDHNAESRDEKIYKGSTPRGSLHTGGQGIDVYALKMNVVRHVNPKLSVARTFFNPAQCHLFTFSEGRFAKCVKQSLEFTRKNVFKQAFKPKAACGAAEKRVNVKHTFNAQSLRCPSFGALRTSYGSKTKTGLARSKTSLVFKCSFHGHNKSPELRPSLSIRL